MFLDIYCNNDNQPERSWILEVLFKVILKVDYRLHFVEIDCYKICFGDKVLLINDCFFIKYPSPLEYLSACNFPSEVKICRWQIDNIDYPVVLLYGNEVLECFDKQIICGADFFASAFFMLSRWEEYCIHKKDKYGTCDEEEMLSIKCAFFKHPVVNEYAAILRALLSQMGFPCPMPDSTLKVCLTYDVDDLFFKGKRKLKKFAWALGGDVLRRKSLPLFISRLKFFLQHIGKDLQNPFLEILHAAKDIPVLFFFKAQYADEWGSTYDIRDERVIALIHELNQQGSLIGLHTSEIGYNDIGQLQKEIDRLQVHLEQGKIEANRNHTLLYDLSKMSFLSKSGILVDSTWGFHFHNGFKCGICQRFPMFDYLSRTKIGVWQLPYSIKDNGSFHIDKRPDTMWNEDIEILKTIKSYGGDAVLLWHTNKLNSFEASNYRDVHFRLIDYIRRGCL